MTLLVVRHARAGRRDKWQGDDRLRPLTRRGRAQADALVDRVKPSLAGDVTLFSSSWVRCIQTLGPLAAAVGREIVVDDALGEGMGPEAIVALPAWLDGRTIVVCTHGDVIEEILLTLGERGLDVGRRPWAAKGSVWMLDGADGAVTRAEYLEPV